VQSPAKSNQRPYNLLFHVKHASLKSMSTEWLAQSQLNVSGRNNVSTCWLFLQLIILWKSNCTLVWYKEAQWVLVEQYVYMQTVLSVHILLFKTKKETQFKQLRQSYPITYATRYTKGVWIYQRGNQNPYIEEEHTTQWPNEKKYKKTNNDLQNITHKTKDRVTIELL
jgi:hypothetical protein